MNGVKVGTDRVEAHCGLFPQSTVPQSLSGDPQSVISGSDRDDGPWRLFARDYHTTTLVVLLGINTAFEG